MVTDRRVRRAVFEASGALVLTVAAVSAPAALAPSAAAAAGSLGAVWAGNVNGDPGATFDYTMNCSIPDGTTSIAATVTHPADGSEAGATITSQYFSCNTFDQAIAISVNSNKGAAWKVGDQVKVVVQQLDSAGRPVPGGSSSETTKLTVAPPQ